MKPKELVALVQNEFPPPYAHIPCRFRGQTDLEAWLRAELTTRAEADSVVREWIETRFWRDEVSLSAGISIGIRFAAAAAWARVAQQICPMLDLTAEQLLVTGWPEMLLCQSQYLYAQFQAYDTGFKEGSQNSFGA